MASDTRAPSDAEGNPRAKVILKRGFHLTDWMRLCDSGSDLSGRNGSSLRIITHDELMLHNKEDDCWTVYNGNVYNITQYIQYHPGGVAKLMMGAGKDCTALFNKYHQWVNAVGMIGKCLVGTYHSGTSTRVIEEGDEEES